jgi:hypothetical protein
MLDERLCREDNMISVDVQGFPGKTLKSFFDVVHFPFDVRSIREYSRLAFPPPDQ